MCICIEADDLLEEEEEEEEGDHEGLPEECDTKEVQ